jgi:DNA-binding LacI/PurR family transcriptional regulator
MTLGVVVRLHQGEFDPALEAYLFALSDAARERGYSIVLLTDVDGVEAVRRVIAGRQVDGLVLLSVVNDDPRLEPIQAAGFPAVLIGMPDDPRGIDAVDLDFAAGARILIDHLADCGHVDAMFVKWPNSFYTSGSTYALRFAEAARARAKERSIRLVERPLPVEPSKAREHLRELVQDADNPRALIVHNDTAVAMLPLVLHDLGLSMPTDLSVVSLHSAELAQMFALDVTSVASSPLVVSAAAVELLVERLAQPESDAQSQLVAPTLISRGSVSLEAGDATLQRG